MNKTLRRTLFLLALLTSIGLLPPAYADNSAAEIKSAFIYNFAKFVDWPPAAFATSNSPLQVCAWGNSELIAKLPLLNGHEAQGHSIRVRNLEGNSNWQGCHILVIGAGNDNQRQQILKAVATSSVLTISDNPDFSQQGGMVGLFIEANHVQFSVNLNAAQQSGLRLSPRMLQLAYNLR